MMLNVVSKCKLLTSRAYVKNNIKSMPPYILGTSFGMIAYQNPITINKQSRYTDSKIYDWNRQNQTQDPSLIGKTPQNKQTLFCIVISATEHFITIPQPGHPQSLTI